MKRRSGSSDEPLDTWIERVLRKDERALARATRKFPGTIVSVTSKRAMAETDEGLVEARLFGIPAVVGDEVILAVLEGGETVVGEVTPRRTKLSRPDVGRSQREQVIVANIDVVIVVVSVVTPPLHPRLIDRYLVAIQQGGAEPLIFVNKLDLLEDHSELDILDPYRTLGINMLQGSTFGGIGHDELLGEIRGKTCAFVGHSGVGKSSIVNALKPDAGQKTGSVSEGYGRGMHTTTASSLHRLSDGTVLIDTPGIRSFGLRDLDETQIASYFPEFLEHSCKFNDCTHSHEPGCGVIAAVEAGEIERVRYDAYLRLRSELSSE